MSPSKATMEQLHKVPERTKISKNLQIIAASHGHSFLLCMYHQDVRSEVICQYRQISRPPDPGDVICRLVHTGDLLEGAQDGLKALKAGRIHQAAQCLGPVIGNLYRTGIV